MRDLTNISPGYMWLEEDSILQPYFRDRDKVKTKARNLFDGKAFLTICFRFSFNKFQLQEFQARTPNHYCVKDRRRPNTVVYGLSSKLTGFKFVKFFPRKLFKLKKQAKQNNSLSPIKFGINAAESIIDPV
ncbi:hypothetical protein TNCV_2240001 [Trichonephila clavipes]|nr:hypothetical protein TNCV_2240001 [Trichonephila clavipes]